MTQEDADWLLAPLPSGRHRLTREQVIQSQRMRLLAASIAVAGSEGYAAMTVTAVIARANVSRKTFYEQFADREECFLAAYELVRERAMRGMHEAFAGDAPWPARLRATLSWTLEALSAHPHEARIAFVEVLAAGAEALARRDETVEELAALLAPGVAAAPRGAVLPSSMPRAIVGALSELIAAHVRRGTTAALPELLPDLLYCALAPFVGPVEAAQSARAHGCALAAHS